MILYIKDGLTSTIPCSCPPTQLLLDSTKKSAFIENALKGFPDNATFIQSLFHYYYYFIHCNFNDFSAFFEHLLPGKRDNIVDSVSQSCLSAFLVV